MRTRSGWTDLRLLFGVWLLLFAPGNATAQSVTTANLGANQFTLQYTGAAIGTSYVTLLNNGAACGSASQVMSGTDIYNLPAYRAWSMQLTAAAGSYTMRNLAASTGYTACLLENGASSPVGVSVTTTAVPNIASPQWQVVGTGAFAPSCATFSGLAFSPDGTPYAGCENVWKYTSGAWSQVGNTIASNYGPISYGFSPDGTLYVAFADPAANGLLTVQRFNGTTWETVGSAGFSSQRPNNSVQLLFSPQGYPSVVYTGGTAPYDGWAGWVQYDGSNWTTVSNLDDFTNGSVSAAFAPDGSLYLAYANFAYGNSSGEAFVERYLPSTGSFQQLGYIPAYSLYCSTSTPCTTSSLSLTVAPDGTPYLAYSFNITGYVATVLKFNGTSWVPVGAAASTGSAFRTMLAISPDGAPYVAYGENLSSSTSVTVKKYNGSTWATVGNPDFTPNGNAPQLGFSPSGTPYVAFDDLSTTTYNPTVVLLASNPLGFNAATYSANSITASSAILPGVVASNAGDATVTFEWGLTSSYGSTVLATTPPSGIVPNGSGNTVTSVGITGLSPATTYHYHVNATVGGTTVSGIDDTFTTTKMAPAVTWPTASSITYGQTLSSSALIGGSASVAGTFSWTASSIVPPLGISSQAVIFTPADTTHYTTASGFVNVTVNPPTVTAIGTSNVGANQVTLELTSNTTETGYFTLLNGMATCGTAAQTVAGLDSSGAAALRRGSLPLSANVAGLYTVWNLTASTAYTVCFAPSASASTVSSTTVTTSAATTWSSPTWTAFGGAFAGAGVNTCGSIAFSPEGTLYAACKTSTNDVALESYDGSAWVLLGTIPVSSGGLQSIAVTFSPGGTPYVFYSDFNVLKSFVFEYVGGSFHQVGASISQSEGSASLAFSPDGTPYVAYLDAANRYYVTVVRYNGTSWVTVGSAGFSQLQPGMISLAIAPDGAPYVAFDDLLGTQKASVMKYNGVSWVYVGLPGFTPVTVSSQTLLAFAPDGTPYIAYSDNSSAQLGSVMKFNGSLWIPVGPLSFAPAIISSLAFAPDGSPNVLSQNYVGQPQLNTILRYDGASWNAINFSSSTTPQSNLLFSPDGTPYFAGTATTHPQLSVWRLASSTLLTTGAASNVTTTGATLNGMVNDNGSNATTIFEYGTTASYGTTITPTTPPGGVVQAGSGNTAVQAAIANLSPGTTYHFRMDATINGAALYGSDATFATQKPAPVVTTWPTASSIIYGQILSNSTLTGGTASVPGAFAWTNPNTVPTAGTSAYAVTFTPADTATYSSVSGSVSLTVTPATPSITWATPPAVTYGTALSTVQLNASSSVAGTFTYTPSAGAILPVGPQTLSVTFTPSDTSSYSSSTVTVLLTVTKATPTISWSAPAAIIYGTVLSGTQLNATSSVAGTFAYSSGTGAVLAAGNQTLSVTFTPTDTTNYNNATSTVPLTVGKAPLSATAANASRVYGAANPTFTGNITGAVNGDAFSETFATVATSASPAGTYAIVPTVSGTALANYTVAATNGTLTISHALTATAFSLSNNNLTFSATVTSGTAGLPTGIVSFYSGTTLLGTGTLSNGTGTYTASAFPAGNVTLSAVYGGDADFSASTSTAIPVLALVPSNASLTLTQAGAVQDTITLNVPPGYTGTLQLSCTGLPQYAACSFSPSPVIFSGGSSTASVMLTIHTGGTSSLVLPGPPSGRSHSTTWLASLGILGSLTLSFGRRHRRKLRPGLQLLMPLCLLSVMGLAIAGCGSSGGGGGTTTPSTPTPAGTYTVQVAATNGSNLAQTTALTVTVQ